MIKSLEKKFWGKVDKSGDCWLWTGAVFPAGYGRIYNHSKIFSAHRLSWEINCSPIPMGMYVLHKCDNPPCVNPEHLFLGTQQDNMDDKMAKGRHYIGDNQPAGEKHWKTKLKTGEVWLIKKIHAAGIVSNEYIGKMFQVNRCTISNIVQGRRWKHV